MPISLYILFAIAVIALVDLIPRLLMISTKAIIPKRTSVPKQPYLLLPTVYGDPAYIDKFSSWFLKRYAKHVRILTTDHESEVFYKKLRALCRETGASYTRVHMRRMDGTLIPTNAYTIYKQFFVTRKAIKVRRDTVCVLIDADTYTNQSVRALVNAFLDNDVEMASLRCEIAQPKKMIEHLQAFEYKLAMDNRRIDPWLTSGACNMATFSVYRQVFAKHSEFFAGGDIEIGKIAQVSGFRVRHIDFTFLTLAPDTFKDWFKQRIIWTAGGIRHHVINIASYGWHHLFLTFYSSFLVFALFPLRWVELLRYPITMPFLIIISWLYVFMFVARKSWHPRLLLLPFYSFVQTMIIIPVAFKRYLSYVRKQKNFGLLQYSLDSHSLSNRMLFSALNIAVVAVIWFASITLTVYRIHYWLFVA